MPESCVVISASSASLKCRLDNLATLATTSEVIRAGLEPDDGVLTTRNAIG
jgi:hypothetical protein